MRPQTPVPLTLEEHRELSQELLRTRSRLRELAAMIADVYGAQNRAASAFQQLTEDVDQLCGALEAQAVEDVPGMRSRLYL